MRFTKQFLLIALLLVSLTSFGQKTITWYRVTNDTSALNYNPFGTGNITKTGYYNINPRTGDQFRYVGNTSWVKDSLFKGGTTTIVDTTINNVTNITNTINSVGGIRWVTDWPQFIAALSDPSVRSINIAANLTASSKAYIPTNQSTIKEIEGHGFEIFFPSTIDTGFVRTYASLTAANSGIDQQLRFRNVSFRGASTNMGMYISSNYGMAIEGCRFYSFSTAMDLRWCMGTVIDQCYFWENITSINLDYDRFTGGSNSTSQSNHSVVQNCKFRPKTGGFASIRVFGASGISITHNIFEGPNSDYDVFFDDNNSNVVKEVYIYGNHVEHTPTIAAFYVKLKEGIAYCGGIYSQYNCTLIKFESSAYAKMLVENIPFLTPLTKFDNVNTNGRWWFTNMPSAFDPNITTYWLSGISPINSRLDNWNSNGQSPFLQLGTRRP
jgi:hypothetical protein